MSVNLGVSWKQVKFFHRVVTGNLGIDPGFQVDKLDISDECREQARIETADWKTQPDDINGIAKWISAGVEYVKLGVGKYEETGFKPSIDYWSKMDGRSKVSESVKARSFIERSGLPMAWAPEVEAPRSGRVVRPTERPLEERAAFRRE